MSAQLSARAERAMQNAVDYGERLIVFLIFATFAARIGRSVVLEPYNILAVISEGLVVFFVLIRRHATAITMRPLDWLIAFAGTSAAMFVRAGGHPVLPAAVGTVLMLSGVALAIAAKLTLRRSFGIAAANRGVVLSGPYRLVRHPMYAGYILVYLGFLLNNPLVWNLGIYAATVVLLVARIFAEERVLAEDAGYADFMREVRFRLVPGLF